MLMAIPVSVAFPPLVSVITCGGVYGGMVPGTTVTDPKFNDGGVSTASGVGVDVVLVPVKLELCTLPVTAPALSVTLTDAV
jgi:hypothetical protein